MGWAHAFFVTWVWINCVGHFFLACRYPCTLNLPHTVAWTLLHGPRISFDPNKRLFYVLNYRVNFNILPLAYAREFPRRPHRPKKMTRACRFVVDAGPSKSTCTCIIVYNVTLVCSTWTIIVPSPWIARVSTTTSIFFFSFAMACLASCTRQSSHTPCSTSAGYCWMTLPARCNPLPAWYLPQPPASRYPPPVW